VSCVDNVPTLLREGAPGTNAGGPAVYTAVHAGTTLAPGGVPIGFDLLGYDGLVRFHSWLYLHQAHLAVRVAEGDELLAEQRDSDGGCSQVWATLARHRPTVPDLDLESWNCSARC
jgi:hypothetical protein